MFNKLGPAPKEELNPKAPMPWIWRDWFNKLSQVFNGPIRPNNASPNAFISSDGSPGITTTVTTASLVGKTITIKDGIIVGFS